MIKSRWIDRIACIIIALTLLVTVLFCCGERLVIGILARSIGYEDRLFDRTRVHTIDLVVADWEGFLASCTDEEYILCDIVIDGEAVENVALRAKGNTSLSSVDSYGNDRYSFKIELDHYDKTKSYHGLDKFCLNNIIQDNTYMKDFIAYTMMGEMGVASPLASFAYITVNGEDWGLYLAVEAIEESFLTRNYGADYGELYKPDSMSMGGGRGNGRDFDMDAFMQEQEQQSEQTDQPVQPMDKELQQDRTQGSAPFAGGFGGRPEGMPGGMGGNGNMGSSGTKLQYVDDDPDSYSVIFDNAKTDITEADKKRLIASLKDLSAGENIPDTVDIETVIRYFVVYNFVVNDDSYTGSIIHNYYLYEKDGQMQMIPWDYNLAFGGMGMGRNGGFGGGIGSGMTEAVNAPIDSPVSDGDISDRPMVAWIFAEEDYTKLYHEVYGELLANWFDNGQMAELIEKTAELIAPYVEKDPTAFCSYAAFETGVSTLKEFLSLRAESVAGQLDGSIPATDAGQSADSSALVDAGHLNASDMGSMGMGDGFGGRNDGANGGMPGKMPEGMPEGKPEGNFTFPEGMTPPDGEFGGNFGAFGGEPPERREPPGGI